MILYRKDATRMEQTFTRGQIYYVASDQHQTPIGCEIWSDRPALIVSNDTTNNSGGAITVVYLSTSLKKQSSPLHVRVHSGNRPALALCEQIHTVDRSRLHQLLGVITPEEQTQVDKALCFLLSTDFENYRGLFKKWENYIREYHLEVIEEQESIAASIVDKTILTLQKQISILRKERDGYKALAESRRELLDCVREEQIL